jgi:hypothetical protein
MLAITCVWVSNGRCHKLGRVRQVSEEISIALTLRERRKIRDEQPRTFHEGITTLQICAIGDSVAEIRLKCAVDAAWRKYQSQQDMTNALSGASLAP